MAVTIKGFKFSAKGEIRREGQFSSYTFESDHAALSILERGPMVVPSNSTI